MAKLANLSAVEN